MVINDVYRIEKVPYNFVLIETYVGTNRDGEEQEYERETFHPNLTQALQRILKNESGECIRAGLTLEEAITQLNLMTDRIANAVSNLDTSIFDKEK